MTAAISLLLFVLALKVINAELSAHSPAELLAAIGRVDPLALLLALAAVVGAYAALILADRHGLALLGKQLPVARTARASLAAYALASTLGWSWATAGTARLRLYRKWGLTPGEVGVLSFANGSAAQVGGLTAAGLGLLLSGAELAAHSALPPLVWAAIGLVCLLPATGWIGWSLARPMSRAFVLDVPLIVPPPARAVAHLSAAMLNWVAVALALYVLLPDHGGWSFPAFLSVFVVAGLLGAASGAPGGVGVFEAAILTLSPIGLSTPGAAAALLAYRLIFNIVPLSLALLILATDTAAPAARPAGRAIGRIGARVGARIGETLGEGMLELSPRLLSALVFIGGLVLLASVATPAVTERIRLLDGWDLRAVSELSHFLASIVAVLLLIVAAGLWRRSAAAWGVAIALLLAGVVFSLAKGLDWEEASALMAVALVAIPCRPAFVRPTAWSLRQPGPGWLAAAVGAIAATGWLAMFAHQNVAYTDDLWWQFLGDNDAARSLRGLTAAAVLTLVVCVTALTLPRHRGQAAASTPEDLARVEAILATAPGQRADARLALLGDKAFVFSPGGGSFVMYRARGDRWIAYGAPVGPPEDFQAMLAEFARRAVEAGARPVFYAVAKESVPDFAEMGYAVRRIGEEAVVDLAGFTLEGRARQVLRTALNRLDREGASFSIVPPLLDDAMLDALEPVSRAWLAAHEGGEKSFSLGAFDRDYLRRFPVALIRSAEGGIVAFASLWTTPDRSEIAVDLMRHLPDADPGGLKGAMDVLFTRIAQWAREEGYARFNLSMAPLAGLSDRRGLPLSVRLGAIIYEEGEAIYGFRGLRRFKDKFGPDWEPLYLCAPPDMLMPAALLDVAVLTSGGMRAMFGGKPRP